MASSPDVSDRSAADTTSDRRTASASSPLLRRLGLVSLVAVVAAFVWLGLFGRLGLVSLGTTILLYIVLVQAWNLLGGYGGYLNLGMAAFFGVGAYTTGVLSGSWGWSILVALPAAGVVGALFALLIGVPTLRLRGPYFTVLTLVIGFLVMVLTMNAGFTRGAMGIFLSSPVTGRRSAEQFFFFSFLVLAVLVVALVAYLERTTFVYGLRAIKEDEDAAEILGVATTRVKVQALTLGAVMAGVAGGLFAYRLGYIEPTGVFDIALSIDVVLMAVVGGTGTWLGPVIGAPIVLVLADYLRVWVTRVELFGWTPPREANRMVLGLLLVVVALYARRGVVGLFTKQRGRRLGV